MRYSRTFIVLLTLAALLYAGMTFTPYGNHRASPSGNKFYIQDGDSFVLNGTTYRLWGIDAPELFQTCMKGSVTVPCGRMAKEYLESLIDWPHLQCEQKDKDRYGRLVSLCKIGEIDVAAEMVKSGWALDYKRYSDGFYDKPQKAAQRGAAGIWSMKFDEPYKYRTKR